MSAAQENTVTDPNHEDIMRDMFKAWWDATRPLEDGAFHIEIAWRTWQAALAARMPAGQEPFGHAMIDGMGRVVGVKLFKRDEPYNYTVADLAEHNRIYPACAPHTGMLIYSHPQPAELAEQQGDALLPCPFCGESSERIDFGPGAGDNEGGSCVACTGCGSSGPVEFGFKENFRSIWNRRALAATGKQQVGTFPWENLPSYLIDKCEGDKISEEGIQRAVADMAKDARYCPPQQVGEVQGDGRITMSEDDFTRMVEGEAGEHGEMLEEGGPFSGWCFSCEGLIEFSRGIINAWGMERRAQAAALAAQPSPAGQGAVPCATSASHALRVAYRHLDMVSMRVSHCKDAAIIESAMKDVDTFDLNAAISALAARQPVAQEPVTTAPQPGKRVSILESACGPARKFDPVAADAELASVPLVPLWELPELHPRKVASECLTTMERARQSTKPHTANRVRLTNAIALVGRFVAQMERSERLGTAPPAQGIDLGREAIEALLHIKTAPEPVSHPSDEWVEEYVQWHDEGRRVMRRAERG